MLLNIDLFLSTFSVNAEQDYNSPDYGIPNIRAYCDTEGRGKDEEEINWALFGSGV